MNILQALLQGVTGAAPPMEADIPVTAPRQRVIPTEDPRDEPNELKREELIPRKGLFGLKGTARDVLGVVGDAFLMQAGRAPIYAPQRERERLGSAIYQANMDPVAAADRVAIDNPELAYKMYGDIADRELQAKQYEQQAAMRQLVNQDKGYRIFGGFINTLKDPASYAKGLKTLQDIKQRYNLDVDIPDAYDENFVSQSYSRAIDPARTEALVDKDLDRNVREEQGNRRLAISKQNADANTKRANRPPAGRPAPRPTQSNVDAEVSAAIANGTATPNQRAYWDARLKKGGTTRRQPPPLPPGFTIKRK